METDSDVPPPLPMELPAVANGSTTGLQSVQRRSVPSGVGGSEGIGSGSSSSMPGRSDSVGVRIRRRCVSHGSAMLIGRRLMMEDTVSVAPLLALPGYNFYGVYDGHGGASVAEACRDRMHLLLAEEVMAWGELWGEVMTACFSRLDEETAFGIEAIDMTVGSTAVVALVGAQRIVVANCGDSRAVLCRGGVAVPLSSDHKPNREDELERVEAAGGRVIEWNGHRVLGVLATSRSIGDHYLKPFIISVPEVTEIDRTDKDEFLILASDGLWDVIPNEVACKATRYCLTGRAAKRFPDTVPGSTATEAAALLADMAIDRGSRDNISVVVIELKKLKVGKSRRT